MKRTARDNRPNIRPVKRIELSESSLTLRLVLFVLIGMIGIGAFIYGFSAMFSVEEGWNTISVSSTNMNVSKDFTFQYNLGQSGLSATAENKMLNKIYTELCENAAMLFDIDNDYEEIVSLHYIATHPNEKIEVDPSVYEMFETFDRYNDRTIFMGPVYDLFDDIFFVQDDGSARSLDPYYSSEVADEMAEYLEYINDETMISFSFFENHTICLNVSEMYLDFIKENEIRSLIDLIYMKNAFILDYLADELTKSGYDRGVLTSVDGYSRILSKLDFENGYIFYDHDGSDAYQALTLCLSDEGSVAFLHDVPYFTADRYHYYLYSDGNCANWYIGNDGTYVNAFSSMLASGNNKKAGELAVACGRIYTTKDSSVEDVKNLKEQGIDVLLASKEEKGIITFVGKQLKYDNLFESADFSYKIVMAQ